MTKKPLVALVAVLGACSPSASGSGPAPEVAETQVKLDLPAVPAFEEPTTNPDGTHSVLEMRRRGKKFLDQDVKVTAYVVWVYDCATLLGPQVIKDTPEKCDKPHFRLADTPDAGEEKTIQVVDVPRSPRADERKVLPKEEIAAQDAIMAAIPPYQVGSKVIVQGKWATRSPKGFVNSDGLLVFGSLALADAPGGAPGGMAPAPAPMPGGMTKKPPPH